MAQIDFELLDACKDVNIAANNSFRSTVWKGLDKDFKGRKPGDAERLHQVADE